MKVNKLFVHPIKSARGISLPSAEILITGFKYDRCIAVINTSNKIITGREYPNLLKINCRIGKGNLIINSDKEDEFIFPLPHENKISTIKLFNKEVVGTLFAESANNWISTFLKDDFRLVYIEDDYNYLQEKNGGRPEEKKGYADATPVHLISLTTLEYLNSKLTKKVGVRNFRPNIVIDGVEPFEEDSWSVIAINGCYFRVQETTTRCIFTTIDPKTAEKDKNIQPLKELADLRSKMGLKPTFGISLVPLEEGVISEGNSVTVIENKK
ncbi:MOSC domain-containing protein [Cellulophaga sp. HaHaR_3_176]|uniref:MOSC domain-containing protein n=1 Tax=Cellulophaga sp. HaHaR_3_176 TaxID=1942464 RepID=UPI001C1F66AC|nr:MOSC N-terminal beta barrel domain-containing protein [Cellulophaga sp. HaHaR_3_176]QWX85022.1 MOSC domain-containing protein [Cellulophaga sp. HaHaR_3_176]